MHWRKQGFKTVQACALGYEPATRWALDDVSGVEGGKGLLNELRRHRMHSGRAHVQTVKQGKGKKIGLVSVTDRLPPSDCSQ